METVASRDIVGTGTSETIWNASRLRSELPRVHSAALVQVGERAVIVAPHPDDEILGIGGLLALLAEQWRDISIVAVSDGDASHPGSTRWPAHSLPRQRQSETETALTRLAAFNAQILRARLPDGALSSVEDRLVDVLAQHVRPNDVVVSTWRYDGHPDHEAVGRASARAAANANALHVEYPVWMWHWAKPGDTRVPWHRAARVDLSTAAMARKSWAMTAFVSQLEADPSTGRAAIVPPEVQRYFHRPFEVVFR